MRVEPRTEAPTLDEVLEAQRALASLLPVTPLVSFGDDRAKAEYTLPTGSFKPRGALVALERIAQLAPGRSVVAASAGNHALAVAYAAERLDLPATVVVPGDCPVVKRERIAGSATVVVAPGAGYDAAELLARELAARDGGYFLSPFDDTWVMAGNGGTLMLELLAQVPDLGTLVVPVGGGGLLTGALTVLRARAPSVRVVGVQSVACPAFTRSLTGAVIHTSWPAVDTLAEGLQGGTGVTAVRAARTYGVRGVEVTEAAVGRAMVRLREALDVTIEGSASVVEAARVEGFLDDEPRPLVAVLTGGNVSEETLRQVEAGSSG